MPIEAGFAATHMSDASVGAAFVAECRGTLGSALKKIDNCLAQLTDADLWWRAQPSHNSIQNILLHLCSNLRQWILHGIADASYIRDRPAEFADRTEYSKSVLAAKLHDTVADCDRALASLPPEKLLQPRRIQGFDTTVLAAVFDTVSHFVGHQHQIVYITRLRLGDRYQFQWTPATPEQGGLGGTP